MGANSALFRRIYIDPMCISRFSAASRAVWQISTETGARHHEPVHHLEYQITDRGILTCLRNTNTARGSRGSYRIESSKHVRHTDDHVGMPPA